MPSTASDNVKAIGWVLVALAVIASIVLLTWHGSIDGQTAIGVLALVLGGAGTAAATHAGVNLGAKTVTYDASGNPVGARAPRPRQSE